MSTTNTTTTTTTTWGDVGGDKDLLEQYKEEVERLDMSRKRYRGELRAMGLTADYKFKCLNLEEQRGVIVGGEGSEKKKKPPPTAK